LKRLGTRNGFSLIELLVVVTVLGLVVAFSVPGLHQSFGLQGLRGAVDGIASQAKLARSTAIAAGAAQPLHVAEDSLGFDYHVHTSRGIVGWSFPQGVHVVRPAGASSGVVFMANGRASQSLNVVLENDLGQRDSVTIEASGFVLSH
jgi:type IV fimbrial biogenesis protein FimT